MPTASRFVRTTAFKLTLIYLSVFAVLSIGLIGYISLTTSSLLDDEIDQAIDAELSELSSEFNEFGLFRLMRTIERRAARPDASIYLIVDKRGRPNAGNVAELSYEIDARPTPGDTVPLRYARFVHRDGADTEGPVHRALAKSEVIGAYQLLVGHDVEDRIEFSAIIRRSIRGAIVGVVGLALVSWVFLSRSVLRKVDAIAQSCRQIVAGDLSRRLPTDQSGDEFDAMLIVDDSHGHGVMGTTGRGTHEHWSMCPGAADHDASLGEVDFFTGTLGKALGGGAGGFIAGSKRGTELMVQRGRPTLFSNALPATVACSANTAIQLVMREPQRVQALRDITAYARQQITAAGFEVIDSPTAICPIIAGDTAKAIAMSKRLLELGVFVIGFGYPVVPEGAARLRLQMSAAHTTEHVDAVGDALKKL